MKLSLFTWIESRTADQVSVKSCTCLTLHWKTVWGLSLFQFPVCLSHPKAAGHVLSDTAGVFFLSVCICFVYPVIAAILHKPSELVR